MACGEPLLIAFSRTAWLQTPRTIDNARELDETVVLPGDDEVLGDEADDEFSSYFSGAKTPKIMITTKMGPSGKIFRMIAELMAVLPNSFYYRRGASAFGDSMGEGSSRACSRLWSVPI